MDAGLDGRVLDGYVRVSQVGGRGGDRFQSPDQQREAITAWARANGVTIGVMHVDLDQSGGTMDRPGMNAALQRVTDGVSGGIVVARIDRFARTVAGGLATIQDLDAQGARVVSVAESIDPATPMGRAMLGLLLIMAQWQRDQANEAIAVSISRAIDAGRYPGKTMFGYRRTAAGLVEVDPGPAGVVRDIFEARAAGVGWRKIADDLNRRGIIGGAGRVAWGASSVQAIIRSEAALGVFRGARGHRVEDAWPPLVERDLWDRANAVRGVRDGDRRYHDRLFAGVARCANCRAVLKRRTNPGGYVSYACNTIWCDEQCSLGATILDDHVGALVDARLARVALDRGRATDNVLRDLVGVRDAAVGEFEAWRDDHAMRTVIGDTDYRHGLIDRAGARDRAERALAEYRTERRAGVAVIDDLPDGVIVQLADLDWDDRRRIVEAYLHAVFVRKSPRRGPAARQHLADRLLIVWADDRDRPALPTAQGGLGPVPWRDVASTSSPDAGA